MGILELGQRAFTQTNGTLRYLSAAAYPVYILHEPVPTIATFFVVKLQASVGVKHVLLVKITTLVCFALYEGIKRVTALRFLMGMKELPKPAQAKVERLAKA